jgi:ribosomal protein L13E
MPKTKQFKEVLKNVKETYLGKPVKKEYQERYGKLYDKNEMKSIAIAISKSRGIPIDKRR